MRWGTRPGRAGLVSSYSGLRNGISRPLHVTATHRVTAAANQLGSVSFAPWRLPAELPACGPAGPLPPECASSSSRSASSG